MQSAGFHRRWRRWRRWNRFRHATFADAEEVETAPVRHTYNSAWCRGCRLVLVVGFGRDRLRLDDRREVGRHLRQIAGSGAWGRRRNRDFDELGETQLLEDQRPMRDR